MAQTIWPHLEEEEIVFTNIQDRVSSFRFVLLLLVVRGSDLAKDRITGRCPTCRSIRIGSLRLIVIRFQVILLTTK
jgi:hypothetical protein